MWNAPVLYKDSLSDKVRSLIAIYLYKSLCVFTCLIIIILILVYKALHNLTPSYISDCLLRYTPNQMLRSFSAGLLAYYTVIFNLNLAVLLLVTMLQKFGTVYQMKWDSPLVFIYLKSVLRHTSLKLLMSIIECEVCEISHGFIWLLLMCVFIFAYTSFFCLPQYLLIFVELLFKVLIILYWCFFNICFMPVKHF